MKVGEVLDKVPGISRWLLISWERQGYISPELTKKGKVFRRDYNEKDITLIQGIWGFYQRGFTLKKAYQRVLHDGETNNGIQQSDPPMLEDFKAFYSRHQNEINTILINEFSGKELSLETICSKTASILKSEKYNNGLQEIFSYWPVEKTPSGKYKLTIK